MILWDDIEGDYPALFPIDTGKVVKPARVAFGTLVIKETLGLTDEETVEQIRENPYLQYLLGYRKYTNKKSSDQSMMVRFRQRFQAKKLNAINETICDQNKKDDIVDSFVYMAKLSWGNLNEGVTSKESVERYRLRHSFCPASLRVDKIYRTRDNTHYCYEEGICFSEPIKAKLQDTSATVIIMNLIVINIAPAYQDLSVFQRTFFAYSEQIFCCR